MNTLFIAAMWASALAMLCVWAVLLTVPSRHRRGLRMVSVGLAAVLALGWGGDFLLDQFGFCFRSWLNMLWFGTAGLLLTGLCLWSTVAVCRWKGLRRPVKGLVTLSCALALLFLLFGSFLLALLFPSAFSRESVGEWQNRCAVMVDESASFARYSYYQHQGLFWMGPLLGRSDSAWGEPYWTASEGA